MPHDRIAYSHQSKSPSCAEALITHHFLGFFNALNHSYSHFYSHFGFYKVLKSKPTSFCWCFRRLERVKGIEPSSQLSQLIYGEFMGINRKRILVKFIDD
jgi:hypothetical protein